MAKIEDMAVYLLPESEEDNMWFSAGMFENHKTMTAHEIASLCNAIVRTVLKTGKRNVEYLESK